MATLLCPRTICLRTFAATSRTFSAPAQITAAFSTATTRHHLQTPPETRSARPSLRSRLPPNRFKPSSRHASTSPTPIPTPTPAPTPAAPNNSLSEEILTWNRFFDLRRKRRWLNLGSSVVTAGVTVLVVAPVLATQDIDTWGAQISGMEPIVVLGLSTLAVAAGGWLCGPVFGSSVFNFWAGRRGWYRLIAEKEKSFYVRIKRYRADASSSSPQNPAPDYYGEKIGSVKDYRRWLKDQRAFNLKKNKNVF